MTPSNPPSNSRINPPSNPTDGKHFEEDNKMIDKIIQLMEIGVHVAIVTAAGYPGDAKRFEGRLRGLLDAFQVGSQ